MPPNSVRQLRLVVTTDDFEEALRFYRDELGMEALPSVPPPEGRVAILDAGRATLELAEPKTAAFIDGMEVGERVSGHIRVALEVDYVVEKTARLAASGAQVLGEPRPTPFKSTNSRLEGRAGLQLTLFQRDVEDDAGGTGSRSAPDEADR